MSRGSWGLTLLKLYFSPFGRIRAPLYWAGLAGLSVAGVAVNALYGLLPSPVAAFQAVALHAPGPGASLDLGADGLSARGEPLAAVITAGFVLAAFCVEAKRLHDAGRSAIWPVIVAAIQFLFPFVAGWLIFRGLKLGGLKWTAYYVLICAVVGMGGPLVMKLWIGLLRSRPESNFHGSRPETGLDLALPPRSPRSRTPA